MRFCEVCICLLRFLRDGRSLRIECWQEIQHDRQTLNSWFQIMPSFISLPTVIFILFSLYVKWVLPWLYWNKYDSNQIKSLLLSHHHSTSALVSEILMSVLQTVQKNNRQFTYGQTVQKNNKQFTYGQTVQKKQQTIYLWTDSAKKLHWSIYSAPDSAKKKQQQFTYGQTVQKKNNSNLHMDRQCKKQQQFPMHTNFNLIFLNVILHFINQKACLINTIHKT